MTTFMQFVYSFKLQAKVMSKIQHVSQGLEDREYKFCLSDVGCARVVILSELHMQASEVCVLHIVFFFI